MFRRKEEGLFDAATDPNQLNDEAEESATVVTPSAPAAPASEAKASERVPNYSQATAQPTRPASEPRPQQAEARSSSAPTANAFRPASAPLPADLTRNRLPETKASAAVTASTVAAGNKNLRVLTVGNDILLKGEIATCDRLVIQGKVDATLNDVHTVEISENGSFKGSAHIEDAEISGLFEGDLVVRNRLVIYATGKVRGKITYGEIEIERGGELTGEIKTVSQAQASGTRPIRQNAPVSAPKEAVAA